jgi:hypothetical protein
METRHSLLRIAVCAGFLVAGARGDNLITGVGTTTSWDSHEYNAIVQWRVSGTGAATAVTRLGRVRLGPNSKVPAEGSGILGYDCRTHDAAMLKDGRVAVLHENATFNGYQVSVFTMQYDGGGLLSGATLNLTANTAMSYLGVVAKSIAPTGDGGFVVFRNTLNNLFFFAPSGGGFVGTTTAGSDPRDGAGTLAARAELAYQPYGATAQSYRFGYDGATYKTLARYSDFLGTTASLYNMDGLRNSLAPNGWVIQNYNGSGATVCDNATTDGSTTTCIKGHLYESNGTTPFTAADRIAGLADGRVVMLASPTSGGLDNKRNVFYVFNLTTQGLPGVETVGAVGYQAVTNNYATKGMAAFGVRIVGDYQMPPTQQRGTVILMQ